jgi:hypothetical protein
VFVACTVAIDDGAGGGQLPRGAGRLSFSYQKSAEFAGSRSSGFNV